MSYITIHVVELRSKVMLNGVATLSCWELFYPKKKLETSAYFIWILILIKLESHFKITLNYRRTLLTKEGAFMFANNLQAQLIFLNDDVS